MPTKSYILNYMLTAANFIIEGCMWTYGHRFCTVGLDSDLFLSVFIIFGYICSYCKTRLWIIVVLV